MPVDNKETIVKDYNNADNISAFAYGVGQKLEEMLKSRDSDLERRNKIMESNILRFRRYVEQLGGSLIDASELLELYDENFKIKH